MASDFYPHGQCSACGQGLRDEGTCQNEDCGRFTTQTATEYGVRVRWADRIDVSRARDRAHAEMIVDITQVDLQPEIVQRTVTPWLPTDALT